MLSSYWFLVFLGATPRPPNARLLPWHRSMVDGTDILGFCPHKATVSPTSGKLGPGKSWDLDSQSSHCEIVKIFPCLYRKTPFIPSLPNNPGLLRRKRPVKTRLCKHQEPRVPDTQSYQRVARNRLLWLYTKQKQASSRIITEMLGTEGRGK